MTIRVPFSHPALSGHFPGNPVVPSTVILELVRDAVLARSSSRLIAIKQAKFISPVLPEQTLTIEFTKRGSSIRFKCLRGSDVVSLGEFVVEG